MNTRTCFSRCIIGMVILAAGLWLLACVPGISFNRSIYSDAANVKENISIRKVVDNRDPTGKTNKAQPKRLGTVRGGYGNPFALNVQGGNTVADEVKQTVVKAFSECGYTVTEAGAPALDIVINDFWCDGITGYKLAVDVNLNLIAADGETVLFKKNIADSTGFSIVFSYGSMNAAYDKMMNVIGTQTAAMAKSQEFIDALHKAK